MNLEDMIGIVVVVALIGFFTYLSSRSERKKRVQKSADVSSFNVRDPSAVLGRFPPVTSALILICVAVALLSSLGSSLGAISGLFISVSPRGGFGDVFNGQIWRLLTPIFIHFGILHLVFNMMWLWDLGAIIERLKGRPFFIGFVVAVGISANVAQYLIGGSPYFGGMSGVVYGLLGYVWISGRRNPHLGLGLHQQTAVMMFGWYVLCWTGLLGPIANWAHTVGLLMGLAIGLPRLARS